MKSEVPYAEAAEEALIGAMLLSEAAIGSAAAVLSPEDWYKPSHQQIYAAIMQVWSAGGLVDAVSVGNALSGSLIQLETLHQYQNNVPMISNAAEYASQIVDAAVRRRIIHSAAEISRLALESGPDRTAGDVLDQSRLLMAEIDLPEHQGEPDPNIDEFNDSFDQRYDWLFSDFLERRDRFILTGGEGSGKSTLMRQIAVMGAAGLHPWSLKPIQPVRAAIVDLENGPRLLSRRLLQLRAQALEMEPGMLKVCSRPHGINITTRTDRRWLFDRVRANQTELLVIGPLYKLHAGVSQKGDIGGEDQARTIVKVLDDLRDQLGVTLILEAHAPHAGMYGRDLRPRGSSLWLGWPEFGMGIARNKDADSGLKYDLLPWRGPRDERIWPTALFRAGGNWPWTPEMPTGTFR